MTAIEWTDQTWNPVTGCDRVSPGCAHCYALTLAARLKAMGQARYQRDGDPKTSGPGFGVTLHPDRLTEPLRWRKPLRVFVNSMSDLFHEEIPDDYIAQVFAVMAAAHRHTFQVLTKRPERMRDLVSSEYFMGQAAFHLIQDCGHHLDRPLYEGWPISNVWLGVSVENRRFVDRADLLRQTPAAVRFISAEPLLGPLIHDGQRYRDVPLEMGNREFCWVDGHDGPQLDLTDIDWLIVGGESGSGHRRMAPQWVRDLRDACRVPRRVEAGEGSYDYGEDGPAFFFKQWGGPTPKSGGRELDGRTWDEFPEPTAVAV